MWLLSPKPRVHKNKSRQLHTMGSVTAEFEVRHRWRTTTLFSGRYALNAEHVHARSLQKLHLFDWHFRPGLHFACTCSSKYSVQRWVQRSRINVFPFFSTDWRQWWRTSNSAVTAFIAKRPRVAYSCSYVLLPKPTVPSFFVDFLPHALLLKKSQLFLTSALKSRWKKTLQTSDPRSTFANWATVQPVPKVRSMMYSFPSNWFFYRTHLLHVERGNIGVAVASKSFFLQALSRAERIINSKEIARNDVTSDFDVITTNFPPTWTPTLQLYTKLRMRLGEETVTGGHPVSSAEVRCEQLKHHWNA